MIDLLRAVRTLVERFRTQRHKTDRRIAYEALALRRTFAATFEEWPKMGALTLRFATFTILWSECREAAAPREPIQFASVSAGYAHTCGLSVESRAYCWGSNSFAQLGGGAATPLFSFFYPLAVAGRVRPSVLRAGGLHTCALDDGGTAYCWGWNRYGQLGIGSDSGPETCHASSCASVPSSISNEQFGTVTVGWAHTCGLSRTGAVYCWGDNHDGQLGSDSIAAAASSPIRVKLPSGVGVVALSAGQWHTCALATGGQAYCWGQNNWGQVGPAAKDTCRTEAGTSDPCSKTPVLAAQGLGFVVIGGGWGHTCALRSDGTVYCWGYNGSGQLGVEPNSVATGCPLLPESKQCSLQPVQVSGNLAFVALTVGGSHNCGLLSNGEAYCWGGNLVGQLGDCSLREYSSVPGPVCGGHRYTLLSAGSGHTCAVAVDHRAYCWGPNDSGQLGSRSLTAFGPVPVASAGN